MRKVRQPGPGNREKPVPSSGGKHAVGNKELWLEDTALGGRTKPLPIHGPTSLLLLAVPVGASQGLSQLEASRKEAPTARCPEASFPHRPDGRAEEAPEGRHRPRGLWPPSSAALPAGIFICKTGPRGLLWLLPYLTSR